MQNPSLITRLATLTLFISGMGLFIAYEAGYFIKPHRKSGISNQNAVLTAKPGQRAAPQKYIAPKKDVHTLPGLPAPTEWGIMSSSKTTVISHAGSAWMFPVFSQPLFPTVNSLTSNTTFIAK